MDNKPIDNKPMDTKQKQPVASPKNSQSKRPIQSLYELVNWCDDTLKAKEFKDYCPNGLQVDASLTQNNLAHSLANNLANNLNDSDNTIKRIVTGVTACEALIDAAIEKQAQAILVHHGYFWKGEDQRLIGMKGRRVAKLMQHGISLIAYHLPLDAHPTLGNNAQLANVLNLTPVEALYPEQKHPVGYIYQTDAISAQQLITLITSKLNRTPLHISSGGFTNTGYQRIAICSGGAQDMIEQAANMQCDLYISGEISERTTHSARELGIDYMACGHHATERGGVQALGHLIADTFDVQVDFVDIDNPA